MTTTTPNVLRVLSLRVKRYLGIEEAAVEPGRVTIISGGNDKAKTSLLMAFRDGLGGGKSLSRSQRIDPATGQPMEEAPELVMDLGAESGPERYLLEREGDELDLKRRVGDTAAFEDVPKPQTVLSSFFDAKACNPIDFDQAPEKERVKMLLEALPLKLDRDAMKAALGGAAKHLGPIPDHLHPLEEIAISRQMVFEARTGVNRDQKAMAGSADQLRRSIPAELPADPGAEVAKLQARVTEATAEAARHEEEASGAYTRAVQEADAAKALEDEKVKAGFREAQGKLNADLDAEVSGLTRTFDADVQKLKDQFTADLNKLKEAHDKKLTARGLEVSAAVDMLREADGAKLDQIDATREAAVKAAGDALAAATEGVKAERAAIADLRERAATLQAKAEEGQRARALTDQANEFQKKAEGLEAESAALTAALTRLDEFAKSMAENIPIPGLSIADKIVRVNAIPYDQLNTAQRYHIAVKVALLRAGRLPIIFVDRAESLDNEHFEALVAEILASGAQAVITRVTAEGGDVVVEKRS
jgi:hypothetical protein